MTNAQDKPNARLQGSIPERVVQSRPLAKTKRETESPERIIVSIRSFRNRLTDPDNLCGKYVIDSCRYSSLLHDDREQDIIYQISQTKVAKKDQEKTVLEITYP